MDSALITNDAVTFGILMAILAGIFATSHSDNPKWKKFYKFVPSLLLCYFIPSLLTTFGIVSEEGSNLYYMASRYLLPASLVLLTLSIDLKGIYNLGPKAIIMFLAGTGSIMIGGPIALLIVGTISPEIVGGTGPEEVWRGLATVAGSWIGGGANQTAMLEVFEPSTDLFGAMVTVDIIVANIWLAFLLYGAGISDRVDEWFKADSSAIDQLKNKIADYQANIARVPSLVDFTKIAAVAFSVVALGHLVGDSVGPWVKANAPQLSRMSLDSSFFWIVVVATTGGLILSFTKVRNLEGAGASKVGSLFLYILVMTIGMKMNIASMLDAPGFFVIGAVWILIHVLVLLTVGKLIKAPFFFVAVGSQANVGGAASAPIVASAFHPALAPVGVLLAVLGYALGTYGAWACALMMQAVAGM
ncbi:MAG: hypothetical protein CL670_06210 [Balneola sp.]|jgi:uncharacterized membrane protein|nr:hypothetical protein [Balneola sp.]MBE78730.1 hypothetical protein [Balneola sp.]|tara:strand:- start:203 stop:1450 length:1248 start_codon:yes stop_codon:yes gene_type:complete